MATANLYQQIKQHIIMSYEAVKEKLKFHEHTFELVGYDVMVIPIPNREAQQGRACLHEHAQQRWKCENATFSPADNMLKIILDPSVKHMETREQCQS